MALESIYKCIYVPILLGFYLIGVLNATAQQPRTNFSPSRTTHCVEEFLRFNLKGATPIVHILDADLRDGKVVMKQLSKYDPEDLYIGIANGTEGSHHYYLLAGNYRFDGMPNFQKPKVHEGRLLGPLGSKGVIFKIPVPKNIIEAIQLKLQEGRVPRGFSCLHSLCSLLKSEGIEILGTKHQAGIRAKIVASSLIDGKVRIHGLDLTPSETEFLASSEEEIAEFLHKAKVTDSRMAVSLVIQGALYGTMGYVFIKGFYLMVNDANSSPPITK
jgi:hypothetical protein